MLKWEKDINGCNGRWMGGYVGFDDDCPLYKVGEDDEGWYYEYLPEGWGESGFDDCQEAMAAAEFEFIAKQIKLEEVGDEPLTPEEINEILGDILYEETRDQRGLTNFDLLEEI